LVVIWWLGMCRLGIDAVLRECRRGFMRGREPHSVRIVMVAESFLPQINGVANTGWPTGTSC
jgi:hypothetical protein